MHFEAGRAAGAAMTDPIDWRRIWSTVPAMNNAEQPSPELYRGLAETDALAELAIGVGPRVRSSLPPGMSLRTIGPTAAFHGGGPAHTRFSHAALDSAQYEFHTNCPVPQRCHWMAHPSSKGKRGRNYRQSRRKGGPPMSSARTGAVGTGVRPIEPSRGVPDRHRGGLSATVLRQRARPADHPEEGEGTDRREVVQPT
jgi:hypothetical protein